MLKRLLNDLFRNEISQFLARQGRTTRLDSPASRARRAKAYMSNIRRPASPKASARRGRTDEAAAEIEKLQ